MENRKLFAGAGVVVIACVIIAVLLWPSDEANFDVPKETELGLGLSIQPETGFGVSRQFDEVAVSDGCEYDKATVHSTSAFYNVYLFGSGCVSPGSERLNAQLPAYTSTSDFDVFGDEAPLDVELGTAATATTASTICTNECNDYEPPMVVIELDQAVGDGYTSLLIVDENGWTGIDDVADLAQAIVRAPG